LSHVEGELRVQHLEMIQGVIARMAGYSATVKNICVTIVTALAAVAITEGAGDLGVLAAILIMIFALLDAQYLRLERRYRKLFDHVRTAEWSARPDFELEVRAPAIPRPALLSVLFSWSVWTFYAPLFAVAIFIERMF
jgi:hypothetical protein